MEEEIINYRLEKTKWGFYSVVPLPSSEELEKHYEKKYYQNEHGSYQHWYSTEESTYFENEAKVTEYIFNKYIDTSSGKLLDIGAGEGFFANYFFEKKWEVVTCDYSDSGMKHHNPSLLNTLVKGDIFSTLENYKNKNYDIINLKNILEHVLDPVALLNLIRPLLKRNSLLRIVVPNDYSTFQEMLFERGMTENTWFSPPEHLHYFTFKSLVDLLSSLGYKVRTLMADFAIELFLLNKHSNYSKNKETGKAAHLARVIADNYIFNQGVGGYVKYYSACAEVNWGRQVIAYASKID